MKKLKRIFTLFCLATMLFASCSNESSGGGDEDNNPPVTNETYPAFSPIGGFYKEKQSVKIQCDGAQAIYYTILKPTIDSNGTWNETKWKEAVASSKPTEESEKYSGEIEIQEQCIIRAMAVKPDGTKTYALTAFDFDMDRSTDFSGPISPINPKSEDWQDQTIYFILTDRFFNGDKTNDKIAGLTDQNGSAYDESVVLAGQPASGYNGGDIEGVRQKLAYIKDLGFTAIWMTPPIKCQVAESNYHGYHGYWASDFTEVDSHMGTLKQYQQFVKEAHEMGLYVIQDIVVNHTGDYQKIQKDITADMLKKGTVDSSSFYLEPKSVPLNHPEQLPWALNNINDLTVDEFTNNAFYHYNSPISDYTSTDLNYIYTHSSSDLDDIATENPIVRNLLRGYFRYWIDKCGIDGYRIDTALYVEPDFFEDFINSTESNNMGVRTYGISKGKKDFINFGEAFSQNESIVGSYTQGNGKQRMDGMIYFPLRYAIADTISSGGKTSAISTVLKNRYTKKYYQDPDRLVTFIDNHDMDRWGQTMKGNTELIKAAYGIIYTIPGIPQVYYGSEQGFDGECREGMFKGSFKTPGTTQTNDFFDTNGEWYKYFQNLNKMRQENSVFRYNTLYVLQDTNDTAGVFAYIVREKDKNGNIMPDGKKAIFVMNTAGTDKILDASYTNIASGDKFELAPYDGISACPKQGTQLEESFIATTGGEVRIIVPGNSCAIYILTERGVTSTGANCILKIDAVPTEKVTGDTITIKGTSNKDGELKIVLNGDYSFATTVNVKANTPFSETVNIKAYSNGTIPVQLIQTVDGEICFSEKKSFTIERPFTLVMKVSDPSNDDNGVGAAKGTVNLPTDPPFKGTMDIRGVDVYRSGNDVLLGVRMGALSRAWNPTSNLFDHVVFFVFISDGDDTSGCEYHPKNNYKLPSSFGKWDYMYQANGWGQAYYSAANASASNLGTATTPAPMNDPAVDWNNIDDSAVEGIDQYAILDWTGYDPEIGSEWKDKPGMIWFKISAGATGYPSDITGWKFYINNYDFDMGNPRGMVEGEAEQYKFGTGNLPVDQTPMVIDETDNVIVFK